MKPERWSDPSNKLSGSPHPHTRAAPGPNLASALAVGIAIALACLVVAWLLVGDRTERGVASPDYVLGPVSTPWWLDAVAGLAAVAVIAACGRWLWQHRHPAAGWLAPALACAAIGLSIAVGGRVLTAGTSGANIGAGLVAYGLPPLVLLLGLFAYVRAQAATGFGVDTSPNTPTKASFRERA